MKKSFLKIVILILFCLVSFSSLKVKANDEEFARLVVSNPIASWGKTKISNKPILDILKNNKIPFTYTLFTESQGRLNYQKDNLGVFDSTIRESNGIYNLDTIIYSESSENSNNIYTTYAIDYKNKKFKPLNIQIDDETVYPSEKIPNDIPWMDILENSVEKALLNDLGSIKGWFYLGKDENNNEYFIDKNEILYGENNKTVKINLKKIIANPKSTYSAKYSLIVKKLDCTTTLWNDDINISLTKDFSIIKSRYFELSETVYPQGAFEKNLFYGVCQPDNNDFISRQNMAFTPIHPNENKFIQDYDYDRISTLNDTATNWVNAVDLNFKGGYGISTRPIKTMDKIISEIKGFKTQVAFNVNKDGVVKEVKIIKGFSNPIYDIYLKQAILNLNLLKYGSSGRPRFDLEGIDNFWIIAPIIGIGY